MEYWQDDGFVVAVRHAGEHDAILRALTLQHGLAAGFVRGGGGKKLRPLLQVGNHMHVQWSARLQQHLGQFKCDLLHPYAAHAVVGEADQAGVRVAALASWAALVAAIMPEQQSSPLLYWASYRFLDQQTLADYIRFEAVALAELGHPLALGQCAVSGATSGLKYVSPKTGAAVTAEAAGVYKQRLLPLPAFMSDAATEDVVISAADAFDGLRLTGHFLSLRLRPDDTGYGQDSKPKAPLPVARQTLLKRVQKMQAETE
jgi:DNA repair protein RecO (recombination protein O)